MKNTLTTYRPGLLGRNVIDDVFDSFFVDFPRHLKQTTQGYPVADIFRDDILVIRNEKSLGLSAIEQHFDGNRLVDIECKIIIDVEQ